MKKVSEKPVINCCPECEDDNFIEAEACSECGYEFNKQEEISISIQASTEPDPDEKEQKLCLYCKEADIEQPNLYAEITDVELGHGFICKECFDNLTNDEKISAKILKEHLQDIAHDEEFMESVTEKPLTPEQAAKKKKDLTIRLESLIKQHERFLIIGELRNSEGFMMIFNDIQEGFHNEIDGEVIKEIKACMKNYEAVLTFRHLVTVYRVEAGRMKKDIEDIQDQLSRLGATQLGVFDSPVIETEENQDLIDKVSSEIVEEKKTAAA